MGVVWLRGLGGLEHGKRGARAYNGGLGAKPQRGPGAEPMVRRSRGRSLPEAEKPFAFICPLEAASLPLFSLYCRLSKSLNFQSNTDSGG